MSATLKSAIPGGIRHQDVESDFTDYVAGRPPKDRVCLVVLRPTSVSAKTLDRGRVNAVQYETVHLVEVRDPHEADQMRYRISQLKADSSLETRQPALFDMSEAEQVDSLKDLIRDHASSLDLGLEDLDQRFVLLFGGAEHNNAETFMACRNVRQLKDFAYELGALDDTDKPEPDTQDLDNSEPDEDEDAEPGDEPTALGVPFDDGEPVDPS